MLEEILYIFFGDDIFIRQLQPTRDETDTDTQGNKGNWLKIFDYCRSVDFQQALETQDFVVVQIDTDVSEEKHFDVSQKANGNDLSDRELFERVVAKLVSFMNEEIYVKFKEKIIFAIGIHSIECWLLPIYYLNDRKIRIRKDNCIKPLSEAINKSLKNVYFDPDKKNHFKGFYREMAEKFGKKKNLEVFSKFNFGFEQFILQLKAIDNEQVQ